MLRSPISIVCSVAMLVAQVSPGFAQNLVSPPAAAPVALSPAEDVTVPPSILDAFNAFPKGGEQLSKLIEDLVVSDPKLAPAVAKHLQTAPGLTKEQRRAAFVGLAAALNRLGVKAADLAPVYKAPPAPPPPPPPLVDYSWLALLVGAAVVGGGLCAIFCDDDDRPPFIPVSP
jgi:hypothetical protein